MDRTFGESTPSVRETRREREKSAKGAGCPYFPLG